jgi:hypothetical protein
MRYYPIHTASVQSFLLEYVSVENNETLSKNANKTIKKITILGSRKTIQTGEEIGILQADKEFWAFPLVEKGIII